MFFNQKQNKNAHHVTNFQPNYISIPDYADHLKLLFSFSCLVFLISQRATGDHITTISYSKSIHTPQINTDQISPHTSVQSQRL